MQIYTKKLFIMLITFSIWSITQAFAADCTWELTTEHIFQEFHDPGYLKTQGNLELHFDYNYLPYEEISKWISGDKLLEKFTPGIGWTLVNTRRNTAYPIKQGSLSIDKQLKACVNQDGSTAGIVNCYNMAYACYDKELNRIYQRLLANSKRDTHQKETLKTAQGAWLAYRDKMNAASETWFQKETGTILLIEDAERAVSLVDDQVKRLSSLDD